MKKLATFASIAMLLCYSYGFAQTKPQNKAVKTTTVGKDSSNVIIKTSGEAKSSITIRSGKGTASFSTSGNPLVVIDGVPSPKEYSNSLKDLASENIESITILKDKTASALYGDLGKDGVIVVTTKQGKKITSEGSIIHGDKSPERVFIQKNDSTYLQIGSNNGAKSRILIRSGKGSSKLELADILVVIDGVISPLNSDLALKSIAPENIKTITILRDQTALAMYGEKARKGVILVTTQKN